MRCCCGVMALSAAAAEPTTPASKTIANRVFIAPSLLFCGALSLYLKTKKGYLPASEIVALSTVQPHGNAIASFMV
jgi:hypothetical protein